MAPDWLQNGRYEDLSGGETTHEEVGAASTAHQVLRCLRDRDGKGTLVRLAQDIAARRVRGAPAPTEIRRVYAELYHDHLERLIEAGLVEYSDRDGTVRLSSGG